MTPTPYSKMRNADLAALLAARGLDPRGTKIQMISRLVMQDADDETARKATEHSVRKASAGAQTPVGPASALAGSVGVPEERDEDGYIRDLLAAPGADGRAEMYGKAETRNGTEHQGIVVSMTPKRGSGRLAHVPRPMRTIKEKDQKEEEGVVRGGEVRSGMFGGPVCGAVGVFVVILVAVLMLGAVVEWWRDGEKGFGEIVWGVLGGGKEWE